MDGEVFVQLDLKDWVVSIVHTGSMQHYEAVPDFR